MFPVKKSGTINKNLFFIGFLIISNKTTKIASNVKTIEIDSTKFGVNIPKLQ